MDEPQNAVQQQENWWDPSYHDDSATILELPSHICEDEPLPSEFILLGLHEFYEGEEFQSEELAVIGMLDLDTLATVDGFVDPRKILAHQDAKRLRTNCTCAFCTWLKSQLLVL